MQSLEKKQVFLAIIGENTEKIVLKIRWQPENAFSHKPFGKS